MAGYHANIQRLHNLGILVRPGQAPRPSITIPDRYRPDSISEELTSHLVRLSSKMEAAGRPLSMLWTRDGVLEWPMRNQHVFSRVRRNHIRPQVVHYTIMKLDSEIGARNDGNVVMPAKKFWALIVVEVILSAIYALLYDN